MGGYRVVSIKSKRKIKSWSCQKYPLDRGEKLINCSWSGRDKIILSSKNIITGQDMDEKDVIKNWQEFVVTRQEHLENKLQFGELSSEQINILNQLDELLKDQEGKVIDTVTKLMMSATYMHYNKGFFDGMKIAITMGNL
jgi:hypothetical protein